MRKLVPVDILRIVCLETLVETGTETVSGLLADYCRTPGTVDLEQSEKFERTLWGVWGSPVVNWTGRVARTLDILDHLPIRRRWSRRHFCSGRLLAKSVR